MFKFGVSMIPRCHSTVCQLADYPQLKKELESKGYAVYDPLISGNTVCLTYIRSADITSLALKSFPPGDSSD